MGENTFITPDQYVAALAIVRAYERQYEMYADKNVNSGVIAVGLPGYWYEDKVGLQVDIRPCTYSAISKASGIDKEDIGLYYEVISEPYQGYLVLKESVRLNH